MRSEFFQAAGARLFSVVASLASGLLSLKLYGHYFTPDDYGLIVVALQLISYLPMLDGGFRTTTNRLLLATSEERTRQALVEFSQTIYSWLLMVVLVVGGLGLGAYGLLAGHSGQFGSLFFTTLGITGALSVFANAQAGLLIGLGAQASMAVIAGASALASVGALAVGLSLGCGPWAFTASLTATALTTYCLTRLRLSRFSIFVPWIRFGISADFWLRFHELRNDAWHAFRSQVSIVMLFSSDLVLVAIFCSPADTAIYGVLSRLHSIARGFLQSFNEASWPIVARRAAGIEKFQNWLLRTNGWIYGFAGGGLLVASPWFIGWYIGDAWKPSPLLNGLFVARFLIMGASTPASYFLLGAGEFRSIARCCEREVATALGLGAALGFFLGSSGVALGYLLATNAGTFLPLWIIYARRQGDSLVPLLLQSWLRICAGFATAALGWHLATSFGLH
jgi:O-antigen/teichoic acid export membrane protein